MRALVTREEPIKSALVILRTNMADEEKDRLVEVEDLLREWKKDKVEKKILYTSGRI